MGDYVDRGLHSRDVIDLLLDQPLPGFESIHLRGNHDHEFVAFLEDPVKSAAWLRYGGDATLYSYGVRVPSASPPEDRVMLLRDQLRDALPPRQPGGSGEAPRVPRSATVFVTATGDGGMVEAVQARTERPSGLVLFVFDPDTAAFEADLAELERGGWCVEQRWPFRMTGAVTVLSGCDSDR